MPLRSFLAFALVLLSGSLIAQTVERYQRVRIDLNHVPGGLNTVAGLGIAVDHVQLKENAWMVGDLSASEVARLVQHELPHEVLIQDVSAFYLDRSMSTTKDTERDDHGCVITEHPQPAHFGLGSMAGFYTWQEMLDILDAMAAEYPALISAKEPIGISHEGRPIHFVRISNSPNIDQDKPEVFYNSLIHAREPAALSQLIWYMWYLLENYATDPYVQYLVDNTEMYFVPCINPDGYVYNETIEPAGGGMWRKNRRDNGDGTFGVDLNRNFGYNWGYDDLGSSPNPSSDVYRGDAPFSEPETQALRDFCNAHEFRLALNHHTHGNLLVYPWGYEPSLFTPDSAVFAEYGQMLTWENHFFAGTGDQTVGYVTNGTTDDWEYGDTSEREKIFGMTPESGGPDDGFWPIIDRIMPICAANVDMNLHQALLAGRYARAIDRSPAILADASGHLVFDLKRLGQEPGTFTVSLEALQNASVTGSDVTFADMEVLEVRRDSIAYDLLPGLVGGDPIRFVLHVDNGIFVFRDTLTKTFGQPEIAFAENGNSINEWDADEWSTTNLHWFSPPSSVTDSPFGEYDDNTENTITLDEPIDLGDALTARLEFMTRWDIEHAFDLAQVLASADGVSWTPLCGRFTREGTIYQGEGEPIYDGIQAAWVEESMSLDAFVGGTAWIRFRLASDGGGSRDGFYFDDLRVVMAEAGPVAVEQLHASAELLESHPNPADASAMIRYALPSSKGALELHVYNSQGAMVRTMQLNGPSGVAVLGTSDLSSGLYHYRLVSPTTITQLERLMVVHR